MAMTYPCYHLAKDNRKEWRWTYHAKNAEPISVSSEGYKKYADCLHSVNLIKGSKDDPIYYTGDKDK